jgi:hypothetical protein
LASVVASVKSLTFAKAFAAGRDQSQPRCWPIHKVRVSPGCREPSGLCPRGGGDRGRASPFGRAGSRRRQVGAPSFSPAVPLACHKQRSPAVRSGQSRSLRGGHWAGRICLTWGGEEAETAWHASAHVGSGEVTRPRPLPSGRADGRSHSEAVVGWIAWSTTDSSSADSVSKSTSLRSRALKASTVLAPSYLCRLKRRSTACWMRWRAGWNRAATARVALGSGDLQAPPRRLARRRGRAPWRLSRLPA